MSVENSVGGSSSEALTRRFRRGSRKLTCQLVQVPAQACQNALTTYCTETRVLCKQSALPLYAPHCLKSLMLLKLR